MKRRQRHPIFGPTPSHTDPTKCFVLMPFTEDWSKGTWRAIQLAVKDYNMHAIRADETPGKIIMEDIWKEINSAQLIIADVSKQNPNVFYELGIAHVLNKDGLLLSQTKEVVPFDVFPFRRIDYEPTRNGYARLRANIVNALQKRGTLFVPLPTDVKIDTGKTVDPELRSYLGSWQGAWTGDKEGQLRHILVVQKIELRKAQVIYAWSDKPTSNIHGGYRKFTGVIRNSQLRIKWPGVKIRYWFSGSFQVLHALRVDSDGTFHAVLRKMKGLPRS